MAKQTMDNSKIQDIKTVGHKAVNGTKSQVIEGSFKAYDGSAAKLAMSICDTAKSADEYGSFKHLKWLDKEQAKAVLVVIEKALESWPANGKAKAKKVTKKVNYEPVGDEL